MITQSDKLNVQPDKLNVYLLKGLIAALALVTAGCSDQDESASVMEKNRDHSRWYFAEQVVAGKTVWDANCLVCHKANAVGTFNWKTPLKDGSYPPPPLNGTAHAWHHSLDVLLTTINEGGVPLGGKMPAFKDKLSDQEKQDVIAYFQSFWSDDIYCQWSSAQNH